MAWRARRYRWWLGAGILAAGLLVLAALLSPGDGRRAVNIQPGMDRAEVLAVAGRPQAVIDANEWVYLFHGFVSHKGESVITVRFNADGKVSDDSKDARLRLLPRGPTLWHRLRAWLP